VIARVDALLVDLQPGAGRAAVRALDLNDQPDLI
jgi:hypothetical protein